MDIIALQTMYLLKPVGYFHITWHTSAAKAAGIHSKARKYRYKKPGEESVKFPNEVKGNWNATRPLEIVVSDMTIFKHKGVS